MPLLSNKIELLRYAANWASVQLQFIHYYFSHNDLKKRNDDDAFRSHFNCHY